MNNKELIKRLVEFEDDTENMVPLNEDGSLDVRRIRMLPHNQKMKIVSKLNEKQFLAYSSFLHINEGQQRPIRAKLVDYTVEDLIKRGEGVEAFSFLDSLK